MRLHVLFRHPDELRPVHEWQVRNCIDLDIIYTRSNLFWMELRNADGVPVWSSASVRNLNKIRPRKKKKCETLCGLPNIPSTSHCFHDETHRTCCLLGGEARRYADRTGNPIGRASEEAFFHRYGFHPDEDTLTPWCTCIGSEVCSFYARTFHDGTHIKYIDSVLDGMVLSQDEERYRTLRHKTPGIG